MEDSLGKLEINSREGGTSMPYRSKKQYKVTRGNAKDSNIKANYEYTSGNKTGESSNKLREK